jgi:hypothetical protein
MAIRIPILTSFDPKGLKSANAAFANLGTQVASLGRNFAVLGAAAVGVGAFLGKSIGAASDLAESTNAVNVAFGKSAAGILAFGKTAATTLGTSQVEFNNAAVRFSAFADRIVGSGNDASKFIADISVRASDFASVFNIEVAEALGVFQSGLAGEAEPLKRFGINLLDSEVKAYAAANGIGELGRQLTETEKVQARYGLLMESTAKTAGDFANTSDGLANSLRIMKGEIADTQAEIGQQLLPVLEAVIPVVREMISEFGDKLLVAVKAVDWQSLIKSVVDFTVFLVANIETIAKVVAAIFILNTAYKLMAVASGIAAVALQVKLWYLAQTATGMTLATIATNLFSAALRLIPFVAVVAGLMVMTDTYNKTKTAIEQTLPSLGKFETETIAVANSAALFSPYLNVLKQIIFALLDASDAAELFAAASTNPLSPNQGANRARRNALREQNRRAGLIGSGPTGFAIPNIQAMLDAAARGGSGAATVSDSLNELIASQKQAANQEAGILDKRLSAFESFNNAVKGLFGQIKESILSSFNLPTLGNSINSITRNIGKLLEKTKSFAQNISKLAGLGLNPALLQQVIGAGPMAGSQLAAALVGGGSAFVSQLNSAYGEFGNLASGIAGAGATAAFSNPTVENVYNIEVNGGVGSGPTIGKAIVDAIKSYERTSGAVWQGA